MNRRQLILLSAAVVAFAGMIVLVSVGVSTRRRNRDFLFGMERVDVMIESGELGEAAELVPWLAGRTRDVASLLSVLKRGLQIADGNGGAGALLDAARRGLELFPANDRIRAIAVYGAVRNDSLSEALEWSRPLQNGEFAAFFAWALLKSDISMDPVAVEGKADEHEALFLARLDESAMVSDFTQAWRMTSEWRYAADAAVLLMKHGEVAEAADVAGSASLPLYAPELAAEIFADAGEPDQALSALANVANAADPDIRLRTADSQMRRAEYGSSAAIYREIIRTAPLYSEIPYVNLAWLSDTDNERAELLERAVIVSPDSWIAIEQRALFYAEESVVRAYDSLSEFVGPARAPRELLLRLRLAPERESPAYEAAIWNLLADAEAPEEAWRYAAWYFAGRGATDELSLVLERWGSDSAWAQGYRAIMDAWRGRWDQAYENLLAAHDSAPSWMTAFNLGATALASGDASAGTMWLQESAVRAREAGYPESSEVVFVTIARSAESDSQAREAAREALGIDPVNHRALLILQSVGG